MTVRKYKHSTLDEVFRRMLKQIRAPLGCRIDAFKKREDGSYRKVRTDMVVRRRVISDSSFPCPADSCTVADFLDNVYDAISTQLRERDIELRLVGPFDWSLAGDNTLGRLRNLPPEAFAVMVEGLDDSYGEEADPRDVFVMMARNITPLSTLGLKTQKLLYAEMRELLGEDFDEVLKLAAAKVAQKDNAWEGPTA